MQLRQTLDTVASAALSAAIFPVANLGGGISFQISGEPVAAGLYFPDYLIGGFYRWNPSAFRVYLQFAKTFCRWFCTADWLHLSCYHFSIISPLLRPLVHRLSGISISFSPIICFDFPPPSDARSIFPQPALPALPALCVLCLMGRIG